MSVMKLTHKEHTIVLFENGKKHHWEAWDGDDLVGKGAQKTMKITEAVARRFIDVRSADVPTQNSPAGLIAARRA